MALPPLRMTDSRESLFFELGFDPLNTAHTDIYQDMNNETLDAYEELIEVRDNLKPEASDKSPPNAYGHFKEEAIERALEKIVTQASPTTRPYFRRGLNARGDQFWVARWFLWHVFHNRGKRSKSKSVKTQPSSNIGGDGGADGDNDRNRKEAAAGSSSTATATPTKSSNYYDPVRDQ
ncbi:MAG: hypothetical protein M1837_004261 [Sclerophora amabilis]|nr:MAG: hypothetical protein M1837_004261 [Sclerophora amabilis]